MNALAAIPKKRWRPHFNSQGIRVEGPGLARMERLLERLALSFQGTKIIRVVGTSGKGSTSLMIAESLQAAGRPTAAFFSPNVTSLAERFWIRGALADAGAAGRAAARVADVAAAMAKEDEVGPPSFFESSLALLLVAAGEEGCEYIVLEAGLGGTYDATNAVGPGVLEVITPIGLDHTDLLGDTIGRIARDKAGIITPGGRVITAPLAPEAENEVVVAARERNAERHRSPEVAGFEMDEAGCLFDLDFGGNEIWEGVRTQMIGAHQAMNATLAAGACHLLGVGEADIRTGLYVARLPCRIERMPGEPAVILDGAHNRDKARALVDSLTAWPLSRRLFVLGAIGDKDYLGLAEELAGQGERFFVTAPPGGAPRPGLAPGKFARALRDAGAARVSEFLDPWQAFEVALRVAGEDDLVIVAGSLYLAGEFRKKWVGEELIIETGTPFPPEVWV
ncbi:MAG: hypothetical protein HOJ95_03195 [Nitrospinaceae bacterium]|nr:hypothetical protein [Nitrospinaceae bacterium]